jgi:hypothetical protein
MSGHDEPKATSLWRVVIVVFSGEPRDRLGQRGREFVRGLGGREPDLGLDGEGRQLLTGIGRQSLELTNVLNDAGTGGDQVCARKAVANFAWSRRRSAKCGGADDVPSGGGLQQAFTRVADLSLADRAQESGRFQLADVVAESLARELEGASGAGGGVGVAEVVEDPGADGIEEGGRLGWALDDGEELLGGHDK